MKPITRRNFMKHSVAAGVGLAMAHPFSRARGANDDILVAVMGINGRGESHIDAFREMKGVRVAALCDVDMKVLERCAKPFRDSNQNVDTYIDIRDLLDDESIDAISIATTNHWHSLATVWACQAGKDVYVEKPCSHNVFEGRKCVEAAQKYKRIVQHGTQSRASNDWARQIAAVQSGKYGKLLVSKGYCCKPRWSIGYKPVKTPPKNLEFNLWLGPAPMQPYHENLVHYNWHWFWDTGNGDMGNQGVHQMDIARWAIKGATLPKSVISMGGRWVDGPNYFKDQAETPNQELCIYDYDGTLLVFETRGLVGKYEDFPRKVDNEFYLEEGAVIGGKFYPKGSDKAEELVDVDYPKRTENIFENFISCVRSRKREDLYADILEAHLSSALCHLGNISYRMGQEVPFGQDSETLGECKIVRDSVKMVLENAKAIGLDPARCTYRLGPKLQLDATKEEFVDNPAANNLLTRPYRKPFVVPKQV
ncbi:MAG: Gfo/Idh/MocA family oxidoreductase [Sedimentisphaerales bacterium]|nr:Gfo/Idh/MocA family oxidoreductase [Sedimentisphaerales bacterium]